MNLRSLFFCCKHEKKPINVPQPQFQPPQAPNNIPNPKEFAVFALHDFTATDTDELSFKYGELLMVTDDSNQDWWLARNPTTGEKGMIPYNYVTKDQGASDVLDAYYNIHRIEAERKLLMPGVENGAFIVRPRREEPNGYAVSVLSKEGESMDVKHFRILYDENSKEYYISVFIRFKALEALITHYKYHKIDGMVMLGEPRPRVVHPPWLFKDCFLDRNLIKFDKKLDEGNFGEVYLAYIKMVPVAVKRSLPTMNREEFIQEAKTMHKISHPRLVRFLGICIQPVDEPILLITEYMVNGSLKKFLLSEEGHTQDMMKLLFMIDEVSIAMAYLESVDFIHRDLRAANVLVAADLSVKVADFGLTRIAGPDGGIENDSQLPIRWTAPEAMVKQTGQKKITSKADVWSFGVFIFEVLTYGSTPYDGSNNAEVRQAVFNGQRLPSPATLGYQCDEYIYQLMLQCMAFEPADRPTFEACNKGISDYITRHYGSYEAQGDAD